MGDEPNKLDQIKPSIVDPNPSSSPASDKDTADVTQEHIENERKRELEYLADTKQDREQRKDYASKIFYLVVAWLVILFVLLICAGLGCLQLSEKVLIALITATTANIIGLMAIVATYLFPRVKRKHEDYHKK